MKYSKSFERDYDFYLSSIDKFKFCGTSKPKFKAINDPKGKLAKEVFFMIDSNGRNIGCKEPELLDSLLLCKASVNFQIKQWSEGRREGTLPLPEFSKNRYEKIYGKPFPENQQNTLSWEQGRPIYYKDIQTQYGLPEWVIDAVENQKTKN